MPSLHLVQRGYQTCIASHENRCNVPFMSRRCAMAFLLLVTDMSHISSSGAQLEMLSTCNTGGYSALYRACVLGRTMIHRATGWPCPPEEDTRWWWSTNNKEKLHLYGENTHKYRKIYLHDMTTLVFIDLFQLDVWYVDSQQWLGDD